MPNSPSHILKAAARFIVPVQLLLALYLLLRGHNLPGGGFVGGLVAACAVILYEMAFDDSPPRWMQPLKSQSLMLLGWALALASTLIALTKGEPPMTTQWLGGIWLPVVGPTKFGSPFVFDTGVFFLVWGMVVNLADSLRGDTA